MEEGESDAGFPVRVLRVEYQSSRFWPYRTIGVGVAAQAGLPGPGREN
jgi:hypothetical protein